MNYADFLELLQKTIKKKVTHLEIAEILECSRANISKKALNNSEVTVSELVKIENYFGVSLMKTRHIFPKQVVSRDLEIEGAILDWGARLGLVAKYNGLSDFEMAKILNIKESRYNAILLKSLEPKISELNAIKANFDINIDDILYDTEGLFEKLKIKIEEEKMTFDSLSLKEKEEFKRFLKLKN